jgi:hypothetical protein
VSQWAIVWALTHRNVLEGLTAEAAGTAELAGHFPPGPVMAHAVEQAIKAAGVTPADVVGLTVTINRVLESA